LDIGNEIIYNELQELKDLYQKLSKKQWTQILVGKLIDLSIKGAVGNDFLNKIYKDLTGNTFHLPKIVT